MRIPLTLTPSLAFPLRRHLCLDASFPPHASPMYRKRFFSPHQNHLQNLPLNETLIFFTTPHTPFFSPHTPLVFMGIYFLFHYCFVPGSLQPRQGCSCDHQTQPWKGGVRQSGQSGKPSWSRGPQGFL